MKKYKIVGVLFALTCILSLKNIKADSYLGFTNITIPSMQGVYTSSSITKTTWSNQYAQKISAIDNMSGDDRAIGARINGIGASYVTLSQGQYVQLQNTTVGGYNAGTYQLQLRANKWTVSSASFAGTWILDDYLL